MQNIPAYAGEPPVGATAGNNYLECSSADQFVACCCPILFVKAMGTAASLVFCVRQLGNVRIGSSPHINVPRGWGWRRSVWLLHLRRKV